MVGSPSIPSVSATVAPPGQSRESVFRRGRSGPFFSSFHRLIPDHRQIGEGQHRQGDVPVPAIPPPHLVLVQAHPRLRGGRLCPLASSKHSSMVQRLPATLTSSSKAVPPGHNRRNRPVPPGWQCCAAPVASSPCQVLSGAVCSPRPSRRPGDPWRHRRRCI